MSLPELTADDIHLLIADRALQSVILHEALTIGQQCGHGIVVHTAMTPAHVLLAAAHSDDGQPARLAIVDGLLCRLVPDLMERRELVLALAQQIVEDTEITYQAIERMKGQS